MGVPLAAELRRRTCELSLEGAVEGRFGPVSDRRGDFRCAGSGVVLAKLSEALFVETLRRYINGLPPGIRSVAAAAEAGELKSLGQVFGKRFQRIHGFCGSVP
jgi:hypothetical protein